MMDNFFMRNFAVLMFVLPVMAVGFALIAQKLKIDMAGRLSIRTLLFSFGFAVVVFAVVFFLIAAKIIS
jgi:hypothetical protein